MEEDLRARLLAAAALQAAVASRIDWGVRPKAGALPAITLTLAAEAPAYTYKGRMLLTGSRVQFDCWGATAGQAIKLARLLPPIVEPPAVQGATRFAASFVEMTMDAGQEEIAVGTLVFRRIVDFRIWHSPAT